MSYKSNIQLGMDLLNENKQTIFLGQAVEYLGTAMYHQVKNFPSEKRIELPVAEDMQAGISIGLAQSKYIPVCIFPRMNFALCAANQIFNHMDKWEDMSGEKLHIIIKTSVGSEYPLDPGHQHKSNFVEAFRSMSTNINIYDLLYDHQIIPAYTKAINNPGIYMLVEHGDLMK